VGKEIFLENVIYRPRYICSGYAGDCGWWIMLEKVAEV